MERTPRTLFVAVGLLLILGMWAPAIGDTCDCPFQCDYDEDLFLTAIDLSFLVDVLFGGCPDAQDPMCPISRGDLDADGFATALDLGGLIDHLFAGGPPPANPCGPAGSVVGASDCKFLAKSASMGFAPADSDCVEYTYDGQSVLQLTHVNAGFNCCPDSLTAEFRIEDGSIIIDEYELLTSGGCSCLCLFDVNYQIVDLPPGEYSIRINGQCLFEGDERIEFTADLTTATSGQFCLYRGEHYPWGVY